MTPGWRIAKGFFYIFLGSAMVGAETKAAVGVGVALACLGVIVATHTLVERDFQTKIKE